MNSCPAVLVEVGPNLLAICGQALFVLGGFLAAQRVQSAIVAGSNGKASKPANGNGVANAVP